MVTINPYLNFMGNTEKAMNFYKQIDTTINVMIKIDVIFLSVPVFFLRNSYSLFASFVKS